MRWKYLIVLSLLAVAAEVNGVFDIEEVLREDFQEFFNTGKFGSVLQTVLKELDLKGFLKPENTEHSPLLEPKLSLFCSTCTVGVNEILRMNSSEEILNKTISLCLELNLGTQVVCEGIIYTNEAVILYIAENSDGHDGNDICGVIFSGFGCVSNNPDRYWNVTLPDVPKPPVNEPPFPDPASVPTLKILHFTDTHYDPYYLPGSNANCPDQYFCCRAESGLVSDPNDKAGFWGDYRSCDLPIWTLEAMYQHISDTHQDIDMIIWTGDLIPHNVWNTSREGNLDVIREMADLILRYFPGIPVYPAVGNHEADPADLFSQPYVTDPEFEMSWLYNELASVWSVWLPADTAASIAYASFYTVQVRPGLRLLSINSNFCYTANWWLILDSIDIAEELKKMAEELQRAEDVGDSVYIIHHHPPGKGDCSTTWSNQYNRIISRYENTVTGLFYGHTHKDHFELFFDPENPDRVYEIGYIGQSQTSYSYLNPGYKIYTIEGDFPGSKYRVLDHENWILELDSANIRNFTDFRLLYSAKTDYGLPDLSPQSWMNLVYTMNEPNNTLFMDFHTNYIKAATPSLACDLNCKEYLLCSLFTSDSSISYCKDKLGYN